MLFLYMHGMLMLCCCCFAAGWKRLCVAGDDTELGCELDGTIQHGIGASRPTFHLLGYTANWASGCGCGCNTRRIRSRGHLRILGPVLGALEFHHTRRMLARDHLRIFRQAREAWNSPYPSDIRPVALKHLPPGLEPRILHN
jgi:hypothetical protein